MSSPTAPSDPPASKIRFWPAIGLFFLAPLVAEFLLGNLSIVMLPVVLVLAPLYGGGALLVREVARRTGRGWPTILLLGGAYAIFEEAVTTQSLFNPDYLHKSLHLLDPAFIPSLGIGGWWTMFMLNLHIVWSIGVSIALVEGCVPARATQPWLKTPGLIVTILLFAFGAFATTSFQMGKDPFRASTTQFIGAATVCLLFIAGAFLVPKRFSTRPGQVKVGPSSLILISLVLGSACLLFPRTLDWGAFAGLLVIDLISIGLFAYLAISDQWGIRQNFALATGAALAYGWHAFIQPPVMGPVADYAGRKSDLPAWSLGHHRPGKTSAIAFRSDPPGLMVGRLE